MDTVNRRIRIAVVASLAGIAAFGLAPGAQAQVVVTAGFNYVPAAVVVSNDVPAYYVNADALPHDVVALDAVRPDNSADWCVGLDPGTCPLFWTPVLTTGGTSEIFGVADAAPGSYQFTCTQHSYMVGTLIVEPQNV